MLDTLPAADSTMSSSSTAADPVNPAPDMGLGMGRAFGAMSLFNAAKADYEAAWAVCLWFASP